MVLGRTAGRFAIRIVASKEQARAGIVSFQYVAEPKTGTAPATSSKSGPRHGPLKWVVIGALAAGAGTAGALLAGKSGNAAPPAPAPVSTTPTAPVTVTITIGSPSLSVGKP
jgi:hypothetical protein